jgi:hypothetical protein
LSHKKHAESGFSAIMLDERLLKKQPVVPAMDCRLENAARNAA